MDALSKFEKCIGFQWDQGNVEKNWRKHRVSAIECEQVFFNQPLIVQQDLKHSKTEDRYYVLGKSDIDRHLFLVFTIRKKHIRIISARKMNRKERSVYKSL